MANPPEQPVSPGGSPLEQIEDDFRRTQLAATGELEAIYARGPDGATDADDEKLDPTDVLESLRMPPDMPRTRDVPPQVADNPYAQGILGTPPDAIGDAQRGIYRRENPPSPPPYASWALWQVDGRTPHEDDEYDGASATVYGIDGDLRRPPDNTDTAQFGPIDDGLHDGRRYSILAEGPAAPEGDRLSSKLAKTAALLGGAVTAGAGIILVVQGLRGQ